jgi:hypothetical protein
VENVEIIMVQTLPAPTLLQFLPDFVEVKYPNVHPNVMSPLFQNRDDNIDRKYIDEALEYFERYR